jgi:hypothetical protein
MQGKESMGSAMMILLREEDESQQELSALTHYLFLFAKASRGQQQCELVRETGIEPGIQACTLNEHGWKLGRMQLGFQQRDHTRRTLVWGVLSRLPCEN